MTADLIDAERQVGVTASPSAARYVQRRGGKLYIWEGRGRLLRSATTAPAGMNFRRVQANRFEPAYRFDVFLAPDLPLGSWIKVRRDLLPPWRLDINFETSHPGVGGG